MAAVGIMHVESCSKYAAHTCHIAADVGHVCLNSSFYSLFRFVTHEVHVDRLLPVGLDMLILNTPQARLLCIIYFVFGREARSNRSALLVGAVIQAIGWVAARLLLERCSLPPPILKSPR